MRFLALDTDIVRMQAKFLSPAETHVMTVFYHPFVLILKVIRGLLLSLLILGIAGVMVAFTDLPVNLIVGLWCLVWLVTVPWPIVRSYIDLNYDFIYVTSDKLILVDQSTIVRQTITQMNMENVASVSSQTQLLNLFPFGIVRFQLKEGTGQEMKLRFIPHADVVADRISDAVTAYQRQTNAPQRPVSGGSQTAR